MSDERTNAERVLARDARGSVMAAADDLLGLLVLLADCRPYIELEASLQNSGHGNVIGNPAKELLRRIDEVLA